MKSFKSSSESSIERRRYFVGKYQKKNDSEESVFPFCLHSLSRCIKKWIPAVIDCVHTPTTTKADFYPFYLVFYTKKRLLSSHYPFKPLLMHPLLSVLEKGPLLGTQNRHACYI